jgi:hypothetical protein
MTPPFSLLDVQLFKDVASRPECFLNGSLECFRLLAEPLDAPKQVLGLTRGGR